VIHAGGVSTRRLKMKILAALGVVIAVLAAPALADTTTMSVVPGHSMTVTNWYKQNVYDPGDNKIGDVKDVLVSQDGNVTALIISVGGFLGIGEKDVAVPFSSVKQKMKDGKPYLMLDTTKDALKAAPGFAYDSKSMMWAPAK
jgi:sporulation protein YlmC with PRC-barrel domain